MQFWRMDAAVRPTWEVTKDIAAIKWLPLAKAVRRLSYPLEKLFLSSVGHHGFLRHKRGSRLKARARGAKAKPRQRSNSKKPRSHLGSGDGIPPLIERYLCRSRPIAVFPD